MEFIGFILTIIIGLLIGLFGGGGSILTVPVLVYIFFIPASVSTTYSLALVSITSLLASFPHVLKKRLSFKKIVQFGLPSMLALYSVRSFVLPSIPSTFSVFGFLIEKDFFMMLFFAILMLISGVFMIKQKRNNPDCIDCVYNKYILILAGFSEGFITGMVGAGGGFIIVPILIIFGKLSIKQAIANSLFIIGVKSFIGFLGSQDLGLLDHSLLFKLIILALVGMFLGVQLSKKIESVKLKPIFGFFVVIMGIVILVKEVFL